MALPAGIEYEAHAGLKMFGGDCKTNGTFVCSYLHYNKNLEVRRKRIYIIFFAIVQLVVFMTPTVVKLVHHHEFERVEFLPTTHKTLTKYNEQCPICHFEFVTFISENNEKSRCDAQNIQLLLSSGETQPLHNTPLQFFSNRAPPPAIV